MNRGATQEDLIYQRILRQIDSHCPHIVHFREPQNIISRLARQFTDLQLFRVFSTLCVIINVAFMLIDHAESTEDFERLMYWQNQAFFVVIALENALSLVGYGPYVFLYDAWKFFDMIILLGSATSFFSPDSKLSTGVQVLCLTCHVHLVIST